MEGNASVYKVYPVCRITGEVRAEFLRAWGPGFEQEGAGGGGAGERAGQLNLYVETVNPFKGINLTVLEGIHQFIMYIL